MNEFNSPDSFFNKRNVSFTQFVSLPHILFLISSTFHEVLKNLYNGLTWKIRLFNLFNCLLLFLQINNYIAEIGIIKTIFFINGTTNFNLFFLFHECQDSLFDSLFGLKKKIVISHEAQNVV